MFGTYSSTNPWILCDATTEAYWQSQSLQAGTTIEVVTAPGPGFSRVQLVWDRTTPTGTREDVIVSGMSWCQAAAGVATKLSTADKGVVETALGTWWTAQKAAVSSAFTLREYRWYDYEVIQPRPGPVDRVTAVGTAGAISAGRMPDQVAISQTFKTASRKHWGRMYLPFAITAKLDLTYGREASTEVTNDLSRTRTLLQVSGGSGIINPCVASIQFKAVMGIRELQQDNIFDVIRSRRAKVSSFYQRYTS